MFSPIKSSFFIACLINDTLFNYPYKQLAQNSYKLFSTFYEVADECYNSHNYQLYSFFDDIANYLYSFFTLAQQADNGTLSRGVYISRKHQLGMGQLTDKAIRSLLLTHARKAQKLLSQFHY